MPGRPVLRRFHKEVRFLKENLFNNKTQIKLNIYMYMYVFVRGETIHLPHDTILITIFHYDTVIFDTIHSCKIKLKRKHFPQKIVFNNKKLMLTINTK